MAMKIKTFLIASPVILLLFLFFLSHGSTTRDLSGFLRVSGNKVLDGSGNPVMLRGFNIAFKDFRDVLSVKDIKKIADTGANSIRLVLNYRHFESAPFKYNPDNFSLLDSILDWCEKYDVYVILDMHLAPGIQNPHDFVVHRGKSYEFWNKREYQERFYALWAEIAKRYADRRIIAGYDLLNEGVPPDPDSYIEVINKVAGVIRKYDRNHILIVEEMVLPGKRGKKLSLIDDKNTIYSIHFFYPPQFTFYTTTNKRIVMNYPGEMVTAGPKTGETKTGSITGTSDWKKIVLKAVPPEGAEILRVNIVSSGNHGTVWFDDIYLEKDGRPIELPALLVSNNSFEIDYPGISWNTMGKGVTVTDRTSRTGTYSLKFSGNETASSAKSSPIEVQKGKFSLSAWVKSKNATGNNHISLSWHKKKLIKNINRNSLLERLQYALEFKNRYNVPLYVGEFTVHSNPSEKSVANYLNDILEIMEKEDLHWSYWTYYSEYPGIGIYTGNSSFLSRRNGLEILKKFMK